MGTRVDNAEALYLEAIRDGNYTHTSIPDPSLGPRTVNVEQLYNPERYRPNYSDKIGAPLLLSTA